MTRILRWLVAGSTVLAAAIAARPASAAEIRLAGLVTGLTSGAVLSFEVDGPFVMKQYRLTRPGRLIVDFHQAAYNGRPLAIGGIPGTPIQGGRVFSLDPDTVRAFFELPEPSQLECRIVPVGEARARVEFVLPEPAEASGQTRSADLATRGVLGVPVIEPGLLPPAPDTLARLPRALTFPGALAPVFTAHKRPQKALDAPHTRLAFRYGPVAAVPAVAVEPPANAVAALVREHPQLPAIRLPPALPPALPPVARAWQRTPALAETLSRPLAAAVRDVGLLETWRAPGYDPHWQWRTSSQALFTSSTAPFEGGEPAFGARHRMMGFFYDEVPIVRGLAVAHVDHQALRFTDPRLDYASLMGSLALTHPLLPYLHLFEGGAMLDRQLVNATDLALLDTSLYTGLGTFGNLGHGASWAATLAVERVMAATVRESYYGQALRLRYGGPLGSLAAVQCQATVERIDPVVRTIPFYRGYLEADVQRMLLGGVILGLQTQVGVQQTTQARDAFAVAGPYVQIVF